MPAVREAGLQESRGALTSVIIIFLSIHSLSCHTAAHFVCAATQPVHVSLPVLLYIFICIHIWLIYVHGLLCTQAWPLATVPAHRPGSTRSPRPCLLGTATRPSTRRSQEPHVFRCAPCCVTGETGKAGYNVHA